MYDGKPLWKMMADEYQPPVSPVVYNKDIMHIPEPEQTILINHKNKKTLVRVS